MDTVPIAAAIDRLGLHFNNIVFLEQALNSRNLDAFGNERFAFLGDALMSLLVREFLMNEYPDETLAFYDRNKALLTNRLFTKALMGCGFLDLIPKSHELAHCTRSGQHRVGTLFEAIAYALLLDQGLDAVRQWTRTMLGPQLREAMQEAGKDWVQRLREVCQTHFGCGPVYVERNSRKDAKRLGLVTISARVNGKSLGKGQAKSRRSAMQNAAFQALKNLNALA